MKLYFKNFEIYHLPRRLSVLRYNNCGASGSRMTKRRLLEEARNSTWQISVQNVISSFLILILLFVSYSLISFNFYLFYFPGVAAEPVGSARGALRVPRNTGWEPLLYSVVTWDRTRTSAVIHLTGFRASSFHYHSK